MVGVGGQVALLVGVGGQVVELVGQLGVRREVHVLPAVGAHGHGGGHAALLGEVLVEEAVAAGGAAEQGQPAAALDPGRRLDAGQLEQRRQQVDVEHEVVVHRAGRHAAGGVHEQRHADRRVVGRALVPEAALLAAQVAVVRRVDHHRVAQAAAGLEPVQQAGGAVVDTGEGAGVLEHEGGLVALGVAAAPVRVVGQGSRRGGQAFDGDVVVEPSVARQRLEGRMGGLVAEVEQVGAVAVAGQEGQGAFGEFVGDVLLGQLPLAVHVEGVAQVGRPGR